MASIGGVSCDFVHRPMHPALRRLAEWHVPGLSGLGLMDLGSASRKSPLMAVKYGTLSNCEAWLGNLEALQGAGQVTVTNDLGQTSSQAHVLDVRLVATRAAQPFGVRYEAVVVVTLDS